MIRLTRINQSPFILNSDWIEHIEETPDTVLCLTNGQKYRVLESAEEVIARVVAFRRSLLDGTAALRVAAPAGVAPAVEGADDGR
jgi:flagellar protein FlbD